MSRVQDLPVPAQWGARAAHQVRVPGHCGEQPSMRSVVVVDEVLPVLLPVVGSVLAVILLPLDEVLSVLLKLFAPYHHNYTSLR